MVSHMHNRLTAFGCHPQANFLVVEQQAHRKSNALIRSCWCRCVKA